MDRLERLEKVKQFILENEGDQSNYEKLYAKLMEEYTIEYSRHPALRQHQYFDSLQETKDKQGPIYERSKGSKKASAFRDFVNNFKHHVSEALSEERSTGINNTSGQN